MFIDETKMSDELLYYFIDSIDVLSDDEAYKLIIQYKENPNSDLEYSIFNQYAKCIFKIAKKRYDKDNARYSVCDLFQEGYLGFKTALEKYDLNSNNKFLTYAYWWIDRHINDYININRFDFYIPRYAVYNVCKLANNINDGKDIQMDDKYDLYYNALKPTVRLDAMAFDDNDDTNADFLLSVDNFDKNILYKERNDNLQSIITKLCKERTADMIRMYYGLAPYTQRYNSASIGEKYNISRQCTINIIKRSIKQIQERLINRQDDYEF